MRTNKSSVIAWVALAALAVFAAPNIIALIRGPAPTPGVFAASLTLDQAMTQAEDEGKPVLVLVTADWCPPCQALKRGALADESVASWIAGNTVAVYLEDGADAASIASLPVRSYPTTLLIDGGSVTTAVVGNEKADRYLEKLKSAAAGS